jgi:streptogramin lyase
MRLVLAVILVGALAPVALGGASKAPPAPVESAVVSTGPAPCGVAASAGTVWVGVYETGMLLRLDRRGRVVRRVRVGSSACRVAVTADSVWVTRDRASELVRVNRRSGRTRKVAVAAEPFDVLFAAGSLWVTSHATGTVFRLDPRTGRQLGHVEVGAEPAGLALCRGRVWVGHGGDANWVSSIDPATLEARRVEMVTAAPGWPACIRGVLWVVAPGDVVRIDPRRGRLLTVLRTGETLADAAAAPDGLVWVTDKQHSVVHRIAPDGRYLIDSFPAGPGAFALARTGSAMWVTSFAGSDVRRFVP